MMIHPPRQPLTGVITVINEDLKLDPLNYSNLMHAYLTEVSKGIATGDYSRADKILGYIGSMQRNSDNAGYLASESKINAEILYNKLQIFIVLRNVYSILSVMLLLLAFIDNLRVKKNKIITWSLNISIIALGLGLPVSHFRNDPPLVPDRSCTLEQRL